MLVNSFLLFHNHHKAHAIMLKIGSNTSYSCQCYCDLALNSPTVYNFMTDNMSQTILLFYLQAVKTV